MEDEANKDTRLARTDRRPVTPFGAAWRSLRDRRTDQDSRNRDVSDRLDRLEKEQTEMALERSELGGRSHGGHHEMHLVRASRGASIIGTSTNRETIVVTDSELQHWLSDSSSTGMAPATANVVTAVDGSVPLTPLLPPAGQGVTKYAGLYAGFSTANNYRGLVTITYSWFSTKTRLMQSVSVTASLEADYSTFWILPYYQAGTLLKLDTMDIGPASSDESTGTPVALVTAGQLGTGIPAAAINLDAASSQTTVNPQAATISAAAGGSLPGLIVSAVALTSTNEMFKRMIDKEHLHLHHSVRERLRHPEDER